MLIKYYLKEKCKLCTAFDDNAKHRKDFSCKGTGFTRGADVTELIQRMKLVKTCAGEDFEDLIEVVEEK